VFLRRLRDRDSLNVPAFDESHLRLALAFRLEWSGTRTRATTSCESRRGGRPPEGGLPEQPIGAPLVRGDEVVDEVEDVLAIQAEDPSCTTARPV
jgi:hypothetical protein